MLSEVLVCMYICMYVWFACLRGGVDGSFYVGALVSCAHAQPLTLRLGHPNHPHPTVFGGNMFYFANICNIML